MIKIATLIYNTAEALAEWTGIKSNTKYTLFTVNANLEREKSREMMTYYHVPQTVKLPCIIIADDKESVYLDGKDVISNFNTNYIQTELRR